MLSFGQAELNRHSDPTQEAVSRTQLHRNWQTISSIICPMAHIPPARRRAKVSVTIDPSLLKAVDAYIQRHDDMDRSKVMDAALTTWYAACQERAMVEQFSVAEPQEQTERQAWRRIRRAAARQKLKRSDR